MDKLLEYRQNLLDNMQFSLVELKTLLAVIPSDHRLQPVEVGGWSVHQILAHLRDKQAQAYLPRLRKILLDASPCLDSFSGEAWMDTYYRVDEPANAILAEFEALWLEELRLISSLPAGGWSRSGRHPIWGLRTVQWWIEQSLAHTRQHLAQVKSFVQKEGFAHNQFPQAVIC